jgi:hypothetical protein
MIHKNLLMLEEVAQGLGSLKEEMVFIGGATTVLYFDDPSIPSSTPSDDVDLVVEVSSRLEYEKLEKRLDKRGFHPPRGEENPPICRKEYKGILVDVMPADPALLGFSNRWYADAIAAKVSIKLPSGTEIFILSLPYFIAAKLEAYSSRGEGEMRWSQDIEDVVTVLSGRRAVVDEVASAPSKVKIAIRNHFIELTREADLFEEAADGFLRGGSSRSGDAKRVLKIAQALARS